MDNNELGRPGGLPMNGAPEGSPPSVGIPDATSPVLTADLDYRNLAHAYALANELELVPAHQHPEVCAFVVDWDLMRPQWWIRLLLWIARRRHGHTLPVWVRLADQNPFFAVELIKATADHIRHGKDRSTNDAAGGFNQKEMDHLQGALLQLSHDPFYAQTMSAGTAETEGLGAKPASVVGETDAPKSSTLSPKGIQ